MKVNSESTKTFKIFFEILSEFFEDGIFLFNKDEFCIANHDKYSCGFLKITIKKDNFTTYEIKDGEKIALNLEKPNKIFNESKENESLQIYSEDSRLILEIKGDTKKKFKIPTLPLNEEEILEPNDLKFKTTIKLPYNTFEEILSNASTMGTSMIIKLTSDKKVLFFSKESNQEVEIELTEKLFEKINIESESINIESKYSLEYLRKFIKSCKSLNPEFVTLSFGDDYPIKIAIRDKNLEVFYIMGPIIN